MAVVQPLRHDVTALLLVADDPAVRYFARRDLLDDDPGPIENLWDLAAGPPHPGPTAARREVALLRRRSGDQARVLECVWPAALTAARKPFKSHTWAAGLSVVVQRDGGDLERTRRLGLARFQTAVSRALGHWGGRKPCGRITRNLYAAVTDPAGVLAHRRGALERVELVMADWHHTRERLADVEARMPTVLDELGLTDLTGSIPGLSALGAAAILAQTGGLTRFTSARAVVASAGWSVRG